LLCKPQHELEALRRSVLEYPVKIAVEKVFAVLNRMTACTHMEILLLFTGVI